MERSPQESLCVQEKTGRLREWTQSRVRVTLRNASDFSYEVWFLFDLVVCILIK